jgi:subtilisin-like proprotein convertase family protein
MVCGDDNADPGEDCDGTDLAGETCVTLGFLSGTLACTASCDFDTTGCVAAVCGDDDINQVTEECDGTDLDGEDCISRGFDAGTLACAGDCTFDESGCVNFTCGDGMINGGEVCDGAQLGGQTCATQGFDGGTLACAANCVFDTTGCANENCVNGVDDDGDTQVDCADTSCQPECADACNVIPTLADPSNNSGNTTGHADVFDPTCSASSGPEVLYQVVASQAGFLHVTLTSDVDLGISAWTACPATGTELECEDLAFGMGAVETISLPVSQGQTVFLLVDAFFDGQAGPFTLDVETIAAPVCGDGFTDGAEVCDGEPGCNATCTALCGDSVCGPGEDSCGCAADCPDDPLTCSACQCGGNGGGSCWCDDLCIQFGDCCANETAVCGVDSVTFDITVTPVTPVAMPDNGYNGTLASMGCVTLNTPATGTITSVNSVTVAAAHTWTGDVTFKLVSPQGTVVTLMSRPGFGEMLDDGTGCCGTSDNLVATAPITFIPTATVSAEAMGAAAGTEICTAAPTGDGICQYIPNNGAAPAGNLSSFNGQVPTGAWQLCGGDSVTGDTGSISSVTINLTIGG